MSISDKDQAVSNETPASVAADSLHSCGEAFTERQPVIASQGIDPENISFLNWNIYKGNGENWQQDLEAFAGTHQVMTIQEAHLEHELTTLLANHDFKWIMNQAFRLNGAPAGVMNIASTEAVYSCGFRSTEPIIRIPKSTLVSYYDIKGHQQRLLVANIHGINFTLGMDSYRQQLDELYRSVEAHSGPMIIAGDFNSWSDERLSAVLDMVEKLQLSQLEYTVNNKTHVFGNAIDHVFYRGLEVVERQVYQVSSSDHNPISVSFRYQVSAI